MRVSTEEFFMYLTIALIVLVPLLARLYRYMTAKQMKRMLHEQFSHSQGASDPGRAEKR